MINGVSRYISIYIYLLFPDDEGRQSNEIGSYELGS